MRSIPCAIALCTCIILLGKPAQASDIEKGKQVYQTYCAVCHGATGAGDGPTAGALPPDQKPRNFQEGKFKVVTDDASIMELLKKGGPAFGLSPLMAAQPQLSEEDMKNVITYVRSLKK